MKIAGPVEPEPVTLTDFFLITVGIPSLLFYSWFRQTTFARLFCPFLPPLPDDLGNEDDEGKDRIEYLREQYAEGEIDLETFESRVMAELAREECVEDNFGVDS